MTRTRTRTAPVGALQAAADQLASLALAIAFAGMRTHVPASPDGGGHLGDFDLIVIFSSGGKDSQTALRAALRRAKRDGVLARVIVVHNDLGRIEWAGTRELAEEQARRYGVPFVVASKTGADLLDDIEHNRQGWPDAARRYCTSDHKRGPGRVALTAMVRALGALGRPARVLQVWGFRAQESTGRASKAPYAFAKAASTQGTRHVYDWLPIHGMTEAQVWADIAASGVPYHPAYRLGMTRLSCSFCVLASRSDLTRAAQLRPGLAAEYVRVERAKRAQGSTTADFQQGAPIADRVAEAQALPVVRPFGVHWLECAECAVPVLALDNEDAAACPAHEGPDGYAAKAAARDALTLLNSAAGCALF